MQGAATGSLVNRMIGFARLDVPTIEEVERDQNATTQALVVVVLAAIATAIGALSGDDGGRGLIGGIIAAVIGWIAFSVVAYFVGSTLFATGETSATIGQLLRTIGYAQTPNLLTVLGIIPYIGWIFALIAWIWFLATAIVALRQALDFTTGRAIGTGIVAVIVQGIIVLIIGLILGVGAAVFGAAV